MASPLLLTLLGSWIGVLAILQKLLPPDFFKVLDSYKSKLFRRWSLFSDFQVPQSSGAGANDLYKAVHHFINSFSLTSDANSLVVDCPKDTKQIMFEVAAGRNVTDLYKGVRMTWCRIIREKKMGFHLRTESSYELVAPRRSAHLVPEYLTSVLARGSVLRCQRKFKKLHANLGDRSGQWSSVVFDPPATFETVAMEPEMKTMLMDDLTRFLKGKEFYDRVGRSWKRGYLLYGPPGTGKSSLIGAIANFTGYDVYDLELSKVKSNSELKELLIHVSNRAVVVVEDIDCSIQVNSRQLLQEDNSTEGDKLKVGDKLMEEEKRKKREESSGGITLSGLLNVTDGLWSCCGKERIFVFTTNYVEKLDPALLRPGRMDMHVCMSYCSYPVFKVLARNYLMVEDHELFSTIEELLGKAKMTPAAVVETLLRHGLKDVNFALEQLVVDLQVKAAEEKFESEVSISLQGEDSISEQSVESP